MKSIFKISGIMVLFLFSGCLQGMENAPDFTLKDVDGNSFSLHDFKGKIVILDYMATWCTPCEKQMEELVSLSKEIGNDTVIISIDIDLSENIQQIKSFMEKYNATWIFARDTAEEKVAAKYNVVAIPKIVVIGKDGKILYSHSGVTEKEKLLSIIKG